MDICGRVDCMALYGRNSENLYIKGVFEMKKTEMKIMGKIGMEIGKLAVFWMAIVPWMSDLMEYDWDWNENLVSIVMVTAVTFAGYFCVVNVKAKIEELKVMKEERKNSKERGNAAKAAPVLFLSRSFHGYLWKNPTRY